jgi:hypothetical protein
MPVLNFKEIPQANIANGEQDIFELFARDFFDALGYEIELGPSRGADGGRDLVVLEPLNGVLTKTIRRWIVSCKHRAYSGSSVLSRDEVDILGRVNKFQSDGFIAFYSTLPSSGLSDTFDRLRDRVLIEVFDRTRIEKFVLFDPRLRQVLRRYFPKDYHHLTQNYTWEKFYSALLTLISEGSLKERLVHAYIGSLIRLDPSDMPNDMREEFVDLRANLTRVEPIGDEGRVTATVKAMSSQEAVQTAEKILSMYERYRTGIIDDIWQEL